MKHIILIALALAVSITCATAQQYDLLLTGGRVLDPASGRDGMFDIAVTGGRIAEIAPHIPESDARKVADVTGHLVVPGLVDMHVHAFPGFLNPGRWIIPDHHGFQSGVTTMVDTGTSGADNVDAFHAVADGSQVRLLAFLNISSNGKADSQADPGTFDVAKAVAAAKRYPDFIVGFKSSDYPGPPYDGIRSPWASIDSALAAANEANLPLMVNFSPAPASGPHPARTTPEMLDRLRPGDILTCYHAPHHPVITPDGTVNPALIAARDRGVLFDGTHGAGSFIFRYAEPAVRADFLPETISTDMHGRGRMGAIVDLPTVMSKYAACGMTLEAVVERATVNAARYVGRTDLGTLSTGGIADITVLEVRRGTFTYLDTEGSRITGDLRLQALMTVFGGEIVFDPFGLAAVDWRASSGN
jgi:dihydroorotase